MKRFDLRWIARDAVVLVIGPRNSGKSLLLKDIMYKNRDIPTGAVISGSEHCSPYFSHFFPKVFIYNKYEPERIESILRRQAKKIRKEAKRVQGDGRSPKNNTLIVMDDCIASASTWRNDEHLKEVILNGRHHHILLLITTQYSIAIPPIMRNNVDYCFIYREDEVEMRRKLYVNFAGIIPSFKIFNALMTETCKDWCCLVIDKRNKAEGDWRKKVFFYKAEMPPDFKFVHEALWAYNDRFARDSDAESEEEDENTKKMVNKYGSNKYKIIKIDE
jgi:hypothetical protein